MFACNDRRLGNKVFTLSYILDDTEISEMGVCLGILKSFRSSETLYSEAMRLFCLYISII